MSRIKGKEPSKGVTYQINVKAFELLEKHPEGLHWSELLSKIKTSDPKFHPKTVNGCVWKLVEKDFLTRFTNRLKGFSVC